MKLLIIVMGLVTLIGCKPKLKEHTQHYGIARCFIEGPVIVGQYGGVIELDPGTTIYYFAASYEGARMYTRTGK